MCSGDMQLEGIDIFVTYVSIVQCTTIRYILIIEILWQLKSKQGDITAVFLYAKIKDKEQVFVKISKGFEQYKNMESEG